MATIRKRNNKYQVQVRIQGLARSSTLISLQHARQWARRKELELESLVKLGELYRPRDFKEILLQYKQKVTSLKKSSHNENIIIEALVRNPWMGIPLDKLQPIHITNYRDERLAKIKPSSFAREFGILRHALKIASVEWGWEVPIDLFRHIKIPKLYQRVTRRIQDKDLELIFKHTKDNKNIYLYPIIVIALETAMRRSEILSLKWDDIDFKRRLITIENTKNGHPRIIPMVDKSYNVLKNLKVINEYVFPLTTNSLRLMYQRLCKRLSLKIRFHDLRHEAISRLFEKGYTIPEIAAVSGHRTLSQLFRCAHSKSKRRSI